MLISPVYMYVHVPVACKSLLAYACFQDTPIDYNQDERGCTIVYSTMKMTQVIDVLILVYTRIRMHESRMQRSS